MNRSQDRNAGPGTEAAGRWFSAKLDCVTVRATTRPSLRRIDARVRLRSDGRRARENVNVTKGETDAEQDKFGNLTDQLFANEILIIFSRSIA